MKKYIRLMQFLTYEDKERMRNYLNRLGFYCLSFGNTYLEVYAIEYDQPGAFGRLWNKFKGGN